MSHIAHVAARSKASARDGGLIFRHRLSTRLWHWTNAVVFLVMLMSGLMIFNAHPRLYLGSSATSKRSSSCASRAESLEGIGGGRGGFWEDAGNYDRYAGI